jgi:hypothetical protein
VEIDSLWKAQTCHSTYMCPFPSLLSPPSLKHLQLWASQFLKHSVLFNMLFPHETHQISGE